METIRVIWAGERAAHVSMKDRRPWALYAAATAAAVEGIAELTPGANTLQVRLETHADTERVLARVREALECSLNDAEFASDRVVVIPACFERDLAPDLEEVARRAGLSVDDAVELYVKGAYLVEFLGFAPGFPYIAGMPEALHTPRLDAPRTRVRAGSLAIAGERTGIYPSPSPGGWRLIGATPLRLFDPRRDPPSLLAPGDRVEFRRICRDEFDALAAGTHGA